MTNYITSVGTQQFSITIASGSLTGTATISAVGSGAFIIWQGENPSDTAAETDDTTAYLTISGTTITATRGVTGSSKTITVLGVIVDGDTTSLIKSVQFGTVSITPGNTSGTASISAVTNNNTAMAFLGRTMSATQSNVNKISPWLTLSGTTVTATIGSANGSGTETVAFCAIEFQGSVLNQAVQNIAYNATTNAASDTVTVTSVNRSNSFLIFSGSLFNVNEAQTKQYGQLTAATTFTTTWNTSSSVARRFNCCLVELVAGVLNQAVQRGTIALSAATSNTATITSSVVGNGFVNWVGNSSSATTLNLNAAQYDITQTNATTITMTAGGSATGTGSYEAVEFPAFSSGTTVNSWYPAVASAQTMANSALDSVFNPGWLLHLSVPFLPRLPDVASAVPPVGYHTLAMPILPLRLPIPFLPRLPDVPSAAPPLPQGSVAMNVPRISVLLPWLPRTADAPPITPADRPNVFAPVFALNFRLPWLATRVADAPPVTPPDKPSFFSPIFPLNFKLPWLPSLAVAPPVTQPDKPNFFSPIFAIVSAITGLPWLPRISDAASLPPADRQAIFSPAFVVNFKLSWFSRVSDAPPVTQPDKPSFFSPTFALNIKLPWLPRIADAAPVTQPDKPNFFSPLFPLNLRLPWLPRISDAPLVLQPDRPSFFAAILPLSLKLLWLPHVSEAAPVTQADKPNFFSPVFATIAVKILSWLPRVSDAPPVTPPDKPNFFFGMIQRIRPAPPTPNRIINPAHDYRTINRP